ncbi:hypothetical protein LIA77_11562 [Sarocladium implicatum]|nr:hypothetical protein LIA77_11562 [Sarocladium implicatum]
MFCAKRLGPRGHYQIAADQVLLTQYRRDTTLVCVSVHGHVLVSSGIASGVSETSRSAAFGDDSAACIRLRKRPK